MKLVDHISVMSETRRWLVRTKDMERREKERKAIRMAEEEYKQLASFKKEISNYVEAFVNVQFKKENIWYAQQKKHK